MRQDLAGPAPTPLETMAVERIVLTWTQLQTTEMRFMQAQHDLGWARYWLKRQQQADKIYREAVKSLMIIRELLPTVIPPVTTPAAVNGTSQTGNAHPTLPTEKPTVNEGVVLNGYCPVNRITGLMGDPDHIPNGSAGQSAGHPLRVNGHRHRLEELLGVGGD